MLEVSEAGVCFRSITEDVFAFDEDVTQIDLDPEQHLAINRHPFVPVQGRAASTRPSFSPDYQAIFVER
jgi:hypothetical protein